MNIGGLPHGVGEWATSSVNLQNGCEHNCRYCYAHCMAERFGRATPKTWPEPVINKAAINKGFSQRSGRIMFPTTHDVTERNLDHCTATLGKMLRAGNEVLVVSKPHLPCIKTICRECGDYKRQMMFRFTIGSANNEILKYWEPGAPSYQERLRSLKFAHEHSFPTSVSCEPMLDDNIHAVIKAARPYVTDAIWLGRANRLKGILALNCPKDVEAMRRADELIGLLSDEFIRGLYRRYKNHPLIKWKDSIKEVIGLKRPTKRGLDV